MEASSWKVRTRSDDVKKNSNFFPFKIMKMILSTLQASELNCKVLAAGDEPKRRHSLRCGSSSTRVLGVPPPRDPRRLLSVPETLHVDGVCVLKTHEVLHKLFPEIDLN